MASPALAQPHAPDAWQQRVLAVTEEAYERAAGPLPQRCLGMDVTVVEVTEAEYASVCNIPGTVACSHSVVNDIVLNADRLAQGRSNRWLSEGHTLSHEYLHLLSACVSGSIDKDHTDVALFYDGANMFSAEAIVMAYMERDSFESAKLTTGEFNEP